MFCEKFLGMWTDEISMLTAIFATQRIEICKSINLSHGNAFDRWKCSLYGYSKPVRPWKAGQNHICAKRKARQRSMSRFRSPGWYSRQQHCIPTFTRAINVARRVFCKLEHARARYRGIRVSFQATDFLVSWHLIFLMQLAEVNNIY